MSPMMSTDGTPSWLQALGIFGSGLEALPGVSNVTTVSPRAVCAASTSAACG